MLSNQERLTQSSEENRQPATPLEISDLLKNYFLQNPKAALEKTKVILDTMYENFGGSIPTTRQKTSLAKIINLTWGIAKENKQLKALDIAKTTLLNTYNEFNVGRSFKDFFPDWLKIIVTLLEESESKNWSAGGTLRYPFASLNNQFMTSLLTVADCNQTEIPKWLEKNGVALTEQLQSLIPVPVAPTPPVEIMNLDSLESFNAVSTLANQRRDSTTSCEEEQNPDLKAEANNNNEERYSTGPIETDDVGNVWPNFLGFGIFVKKKEDVPILPSPSPMELDQKNELDYQNGSETNIKNSPSNILKGDPFTTLRCQNNG